MRRVKKRDHGNATCAEKNAAGGGSKMNAMQASGAETQEGGKMEQLWSKVWPRRARRRHAGAGY